MIAIVYKSTGSRYLVKNEDGKEYSVRLKGKFKIDAITSTNPIAVGDVVNIENEEDFESTIITEIFERKNYINRISPHNKNQHHIVASNLDQSLLFATIKEPRTSLGFIDRFLITSEAYQVPAIIVFNKIDLLNKKDEEQFQKTKAMYEKIGYKILAVSLYNKSGVDTIIEVLKNKLAANPLDANVEMKEEEPQKEVIIEVVDIDPYKMLMQEYEDNKIWIEEYMKNNKPKKKINKKKLNRDIFEIDFMCD